MNYSYGLKKMRYQLLCESSMAKDWLEGIEESYDVVVIGSGLGGLTGANYLAKMATRYYY